MLGDKVKLLRKGMKITQQKLAETIGVSQSTIGMIEGNKQGASNDTLIKLATALKTTVDFLLSDNIEESNAADNNSKAMIEDDDIRRIERARRKMDPKSKEKMMNILRSAFDEYFDD